MIIRKENIPAFDVLRKDWNEFVKKSFTGDNYDPCFSVGYMAPSFKGKGDPKTWKLLDCGFNIILKDNIVSLDSVTVQALFTQVADGIKWSISRIQGDKSTTLHSGIIHDRSLITDTPCPGLLRSRMETVAKVAIDLAQAERKLMHL
jgi:hypothetical protein